MVSPKPGELAGQLEDRRQPTTTLEGWRRFVDGNEATFDLLPNAEHAFGLESVLAERLHCQSRAPFRQT